MSRAGRVGRLGAIALGLFAGPPHGADALELVYHAASPIFASTSADVTTAALTPRKVFVGLDVSAGLRSDSSDSDGPTPVGLLGCVFARAHDERFAYGIRGAYVGSSFSGWAAGPFANRCIVRTKNVNMSVEGALGYGMSLGSDSDQVGSTSVTVDDVRVASAMLRGSAAYGSREFAVRLLLGALASRVSASAVPTSPFPGSPPGFDEQGTVWSVPITLGFEMGSPTFRVWLSATGVEQSLALSARLGGQW